MKFFVERKAPFNTDVQQILDEIKHYLGIHQVEQVRVIWGYEIAGLTPEQIKSALYYVFAHKRTDHVFMDLDAMSAPFALTTRFIKGQHDQKALSCQILLKMLFPESVPQVVTFKRIECYGSFSEKECSRIKNYYLNPLEADEISLDDNLITDFPDDVEPVAVLSGFSSLNVSDLESLKENYSISMGIDNLQLCQEYFKKEERDPTVTELKILDTYWSDHCRHSTFLTVLEEIHVEESSHSDGLLRAIQKYEQTRKFVYPANRPDCLMDIATLQMKKLKKQGLLNDLEESDEVNACSIEVKGMVDGQEEDFIIMFKNETHNHPTEVEPFGGAATCTGGGIRDPLSGRAFVYGAMRITGSADPREPYDQTLTGKMPQRKITTVAADGNSSYGNGIGLASGYLQEYYDAGFKAKRMECGALVAYNYKKNITRGKAKPGDVIFLLGGETGRDGIGGATGSSKQQNEIALAYSAEVQKGNPGLERNIVRLFRKPHVSKMIKKCNDFGAGGVSVAIGELADGLNIDLDKVPLKYKGLNGTEIAISESQERMAVLLDPADCEEFIRQAELENLSAVPVAQVTDHKRVVMRFRDQVICDMDSDFLNSGGVRQKASVVVEKLKPGISHENSSADLKTQWLKGLSELNVASKQGIANQFEKNSGAQTVFYPFGGRFQKTPEQGLAMRLPLEEGSTDLGTIMTVGYNPRLSYDSPFHAAVFGVLESVMKVVSMGGDIERIRLSFQEYFESMKSSQSWGKTYAALMGAFLVQDELGIPGIGGKDSMSGTYKDIHVPPSLISFAVAPCDCRKLVSRAFKSAHSHVYLVKTNLLPDGTPDFTHLKANIQTLSKLIDDGKVKAASVVGFGGIAACISQMCFGNRIGFEFASKNINLFEDSCCDVLIETDETLEFLYLGATHDKEEIRVEDVTIHLEEAFSTWEMPLETVFPTKFAQHAVVKPIIPHGTVRLKTPAQTQAPMVLIPVFPGSTGEYSLERQFRRAGVSVQTCLFRTNFIEESFRQLEQAISQCDVLALPGGMSLGAEPDGSSRFITNVLKEKNIKQAVNKLIERSGLVFGFGEAFNALIDTGLIENGIISEAKSSLAVTRNISNKYYSGLVAVKEIYHVFPWVDRSETRCLPVSACDGQIILSEKDFDTFLQKGQILSVYIKDDRPAVLFPDNPFGAAYAIEGMISENGQVMGRMSDLSQLEEGLYCNVFKAEADNMFRNIRNHFERGCP